MGILCLAGLPLGFYFFSQNQQQSSPLPPLPSKNVNLAVPQPKALTLTLESPADGTVVADGKVMIKGKTLPRTTVAVLTDTNEESVESDASGSFETLIALGSGLNTISITAYGENGEEKNILVDVVNDSDAK